jgi:hypothetical protein
VGNSPAILSPRSLVFPLPALPALPAGRASHRLVYRATIDFKSLAPVCVGLHAKKNVSLLATRGTVSEAVAVVTATAPCRTMAQAPAGAATPETFQLLVKKSSVPLANSYTVVGCQARQPGSIACPVLYAWCSRCLPARCQQLLPGAPHPRFPRLQLRCEKGKAFCYTYRLSKPCLRGRCNIEPDRTLGGGVFSSAPSLLDLE